MKYKCKSTSAIEVPSPPRFFDPLLLSHLKENPCCPVVTKGAESCIHHNMYELSVLKINDFSLFYIIDLYGNKDGILRGSFVTA